MLRVHLLGELRVEFDGRVLPPPAGRRARSLLAWLAFHPGVHARTRVAGVFWPDVLETSARASLRTTLSAVRAWLGPAGAECLVSPRDGVGLDGGGVWVDTREADELLSRRALDQAAELYRAELLPGLDDDWVYEARDRLRGQLAEALTGLAEAAEAEGDLAGAIARTRELVALEPLAETARRRLLGLLAAAGDIPRALAEYEALRERLQRDLGLAPSPETRALADELRRGEVGRPSVAKGEQLPLPPALARPDPVPLVGRKRELERLLAAWREARSSSLRLMLLAGEAGTGKSRLAAELGRRVHASGATVVLGRCVEEHVHPYGPLLEAVRPLGSDSPAEAVHPVADDPEGVRFRFFEDVAARLGDAAPLLVVVEDIHWADHPTLLLLAHVVRSVADAPILVLATYREGEGPVTRPLAALLGELRRADALDRVTLAGLDGAEVAQLVASWLGADASPELSLAVHRLTGGNPLFVGEVARRLRESDGLAAPGGLAAAGLPEAIGDVLGGRIDRLSRPAQEVLAAGAVAGERFTLAVAGAATGHEDAELVDAVDELLEARLVREELGQPGVYAFAHALVREASLGRLSGTRRAFLHGRVTGSLERLYANDLEPHLGELARHSAAAVSSVEPELVATYALGAAAQALGQLAYEDAAGHAERALAALDGAPLATTTRIELLLALGEARLRAGELGASRDAFARAAALAASAGSAEQHARAALGHSGLGVTLLAVREDTVALLERSLELLDPDAPLRPRVLARLAIELYYGSRERREELSEEAVREARRSGDRRALLEALNARHVALWAPDALAERLVLSAELIELARHAGDREKELQGLNWRVVDLLETGDLAGAQAAAATHGALADELRLPGYRWYTPLWQATFAMLQGRFDESSRRAADALELGRQAQDENAELFHAIQTIAVRSELGAVSRDDVAFVAAKADASPANAAWRAWLAFLHAERDELEASRREIGRLTATGYAALPRDANLLVTLKLLAIGIATLGDEAAAARLYDLMAPYADHCVLSGRAIRCNGSVAYGLGLLAGCVGRKREAERHFGHALEVDGRLGARPLLARTLIAYAELLERDGPEQDAPRAAALRSEALGHARELGMELVATRAAGR